MILPHIFTSDDMPMEFHAIIFYNFDRGQRATWEQPGEADRVSINDIKLRKIKLVAGTIREPDQVIDRDEMPAKCLNAYENWLISTAEQDEGLIEMLIETATCAEE